MTPVEFRFAVDAFEQKEEQLDRRLASLQANVINPHVKRNLAPSDFLKSKPGTKAPKFNSAEEFDAYMAHKKLRRNLKASD